MRNFIISLSCIAILIGSWVVFSFFSYNMIHECQAISDKMITESLSSGKWVDAENDFKELTDAWNRYKSVASFFLDAKDINEIDCTLEKAHLYIQAYDISNSTGEIAYLKDKFKMLYDNDSPTISNIF